MKTIRARKEECQSCLQKEDNTIEKKIHISKIMEIINDNSCKNMLSLNSYKNMMKNNSLPINRNICTFFDKIIRTDDTFDPSTNDISKIDNFLLNAEDTKNNNTNNLALKSTFEEGNLTLFKPQIENVKYENTFCGKKRKKVSGEKRIRNKKKLLDKNQTLLNLKIERKDENSKRLGNKQAKEILMDYVLKEGFSKVFSILTNEFFDRSNALEKDIDDLIQAIGLIKITIILLQIKFDVVDKKNNNKSISCKRIDLTPSPKRKKLKVNGIDEDEEISHSKPIKERENEYIEIVPLNQKKELKKQDIPVNKAKNKNDKDISIIEKVKKVNDVPKKVNNIEILPKKQINEIPKKSVIELHKNNIIAFQKNNLNQRNKDISIILKSQSSKIIKEKMKLEFGIHLIKDKNGNVYKFIKHHFRYNKGNKTYIYYCADTKCKSRYSLNINSLKFECLSSHGLKYEDHCYVKNTYRLDRFRFIIEEFEKKKCKEAQVFNKENGSHLVKWYN